MSLFKAEWKGIWNNKMMRVVLLVIATIPLLYGSLFLASMWDPYAKVNHLPVAVVNQDQPVKQGGKKLAVGDALVKNLKKSKNMDFHYVDKAKADKEIKNGKYYMVVTIPRDFSKNATTLADKNPKKMKLDYTTTSGYNYIAMKISTAAVTEMKAKLNKQIIDSYSKTMYAALGSAGKGMNKAANGADKITTNLGSAQDGATKLADGTTTLGNGVQKYTNGVQTFVAGTAKYTDGTDQLAKGVQQLDNGTQTLQKGAKPLASGVNKLADGSSNLATGEKQYVAGTNKLADGVSKLNDGTKKLAAGTAPLVNGVAQLKTGSANLSSGVSSYVAGANKLNAGAAELKSKTATLQTDATDLATGVTAAANNITDVAQALAGIKANADAAATANPSADTIKVQKTVDALVAKLSDPKAATQLNKLVNGANNLKDQAPDLAQGISDVAAGAQQLQTNGTDLKNGANQLATGANELNAKVPALTTGINDLAAGAKQANAGGQQLQANGSALEDGANQLNDGLGQLKGNVPTLTGGIDKLATGATKAANGANQLQAKSGELNAGGQQLSGNAGALNSGVTKLGDGVHTLDNGLGKLGDGSDTLATALHKGADKISDNKPNAKTYVQFSEPVITHHHEETPVPNNGTGMAPYMISIGLWVGSLAFMMMYSLSTTAILPKNAWEWLKTKYSVIGFVAILQGLFIFLGLQKFLGLQIMNPVQTLFLIWAAAFAFMSIIGFFITGLGRVGNFLALMALVVQISSAGGSYPLQITGGIFPIISPFLPISHAVSGLRESISIGHPVYGQMAILIGFGLVFTFFNYLVLHRKQHTVMKLAMK